jgi:hypothetical protein
LKPTTIIPKYAQLTLGVLVHENTNTKGHNTNIELGYILISKAKATPPIQNGLMIETPHVNPFYQRIRLWSFDCGVWIYMKTTKEDKLRRKSKRYKYRY